MPAGGPEPAISPGGPGQNVDLAELGALDSLDDQLGDPVPALEPDRDGGVGVQQRDPYLATVPGIDRSGGIHDRHPVFRGQTGPRVHERRVAVRQGDGHPGGHHGPLADVGASVLRWLTGRETAELPGTPFLP